MRIGKLIAGVFLFLGVLAIATFSYMLWSQEVTLIEDNGGIVIERFACYTSLMRDEDESETWLSWENTCSDDGALWDYLAAHKALTRRLFEEVNRIHLAGRTHFAEGLFLFCDLLARLSEDSRWTADIDSPHAAIMLEKILPQAKLVPSVQATFVNADKSIKAVVLEMVFLNEEPAKSRCSKTPERIPTSALVDIRFDPIDWSKEPPSL